MTVITQSFDPLMVILSFGVSLFGSFTTLQLMFQTRHAKTRIAMILWIIASSITIGCCAVWAMHFIAMLAFTLRVDGQKVRVVYHTVPALISALIACIACFVGFTITTLHMFIPPLGRLLESQHKKEEETTLSEARLELARSDSHRYDISSLFDKSKIYPADSDSFSQSSVTQDSVAVTVKKKGKKKAKTTKTLWQRLDIPTGAELLDLIKRSTLGDKERPHILQILFAAIFVAAGAGAMHYYGMKGMETEYVHRKYNIGILIASLIIAYVASAAALWLATNLNSEWQQLVSSFVMAVAVCGMHYTGHFAMIFKLNMKAELSTFKDIPTSQLTLYVVVVACVVCFTMVIIISSSSRNRKKLEGLIENLKEEKELNEKLLLNILPAVIAKRMKQGEEYIHELYENVTVLFSDIVSFTDMSRDAPPDLIVFMLHNLFSEFDKELLDLQMEKIKTIGDAYLCVAGLPNRREDHAFIAVTFGIRMIKVVERFNRTHFSKKETDDDNLPVTGPTDIKIRVGCHTGKVIGGVVGTNKFLFDVFGSTVNIASRMESTGIPMHVQISEETYELVKNDFVFERRENIDVKGIGVRNLYVTKGETPK